MATEIFNIIINQSGANRASGQIRRLGRSSSTATRSVNLLRGALLSLGVGLGLRELGEAVDTFINIQNRIRLATDTAEEFEAAFSGLRSVANETRAPIDATTELFRRLAINTRDLGLEQEELLGIIRTVNQAVAISGATAQEARNGIIQLAQGFASGQLRGEEFRAVAEQLPRLLIAIADGTGQTIGGLRELAFEGKLTAEIVAQALQSQATIINEEFGQITPTIQQVFTVLQNEVTIAIGLISDVTGATGGFTSGLLNLANQAGPALITVFSGAVDGAALFVEAGSRVLDLLSEIGIETVDLGQIFETVFGIFGLLIRGLDTGLQTLLTGVSAVKLAGAAAGNAFGLFTDAEVQQRLEDFNQRQGDLVDSSFRTNAALDDLLDTVSRVSTDGNVANAAEGFRTFANDLGTSADRLREFREILAEPAAVIPIPDIPVTEIPGAGAGDARAAQAATNQLVTLTNRLNVARLKAGEPLEADIEKLNQTLTKIDELVAKGGDAEQASRARALAEARIAEIQGTIATEQQNQVDLLATVNGLIERIARLSPDYASEMERARDAILEAGGGLEKVNGEIDDLISTGTTELERQLDRVGRTGEEVGGLVANGITGALRDTLNGEVVDFGQRFADILLSIFEEQFTDLLKDVGRQLSSTLNDSFGGAGGNLGALGGALAGAFGIGLSLALRDSSASIQNELATDSIVTDTQAVRGVVAGDTSIPIFQLGEELETANQGVISVLEDILDAIRGGGPALAATTLSLEDQAGQDLGLTTPTLL